MGRLFLLCAAAAFVALIPTQSVIATPCSCRPEIKANSEGSGNCIKTQDDDNWCKMTWHTSANPTPQELQLAQRSDPNADPPTFEDSTAEMLATLRNGFPGFALPFASDDVLGASRYLVLDEAIQRAAVAAQTGLENETSMVSSIAVLMGASVLQTAPDHFNLVKSLLNSIENGTISDIHVGGHEVTDITLGDFSGRASFGCLVLFDHAFRVMVKTRFSTVDGDCQPL